MRKLFSILAVTIYIVLFAACEKAVKIDIPYEGDKIVINSIITSDSLIYARVTNSTPLGSWRSYLEAAGASVALYEDDVFRETMGKIEIAERRYFVSSFRSVKGKKYTLKATADGLDPAEGSDVIPAKPFFNADKFKQIPGSSSYAVKLVLKIKDPAVEKNYYRLRIFSVDTSSLPNQPPVKINSERPIPFEIDNLAGNGEFDLFGDGYHDVLYFSDDLFDGKQISLTVNVDYYYYQEYMAPQLSTLTQDAYLYLQSREKQVNGEDNPFTEAVTIHNNIKGGYGIVGGSADSILVVKRG